MPEGKDSMLGHFNQCLHQIKIEQQHDWKGFVTARGLSSIIQAGSSIPEQFILRPYAKKCTVIYNTHTLL